MTELRFAFGENWRRFLQVLDDDRIRAAEDSLRSMLAVDSLGGMTFLDVGCGSGLFSLAARRMGATVRSFDVDPSSTLCARELKERYFAGDRGWTIQAASILDPDFVSSLGTFDVVYAWGVLHHTGDLWSALDATCRLVAPGGRLVVAIYNDQGAASRRWAAIKRAYNRGPRVVRTATVLGAGAFFAARAVLLRATGLRSAGIGSAPRGMSRWHDLIDWVGGYPFEVSTPDRVLEFVQPRGFGPERVDTVGGGIGCTEFVFRRA